MEMDLNAQVKKAGFLQRLKEFPSKLQDGVTKRIKNVQKFGKDDPRRIIHSLKLRVSGMWAILTVVVVSEFTVGGTLSKGLNRGFATLIAGALGVGAVHLARLCGDKGEPIVLGIFVFSLGAAATFSRFFPKLNRDMTMVP
ncbi:Aluminum-activated malate transporter 8 [Raphanus sativus]|nr:Aluminum-activated malate transporter 8 [Raphanus sativus]